MHCQCYLHTQSNGFYCNEYKLNVGALFACLICEYSVKLKLARLELLCSNTHQWNDCQNYLGTIRQFATMAETDIWLYFLLCIVLIIAKNHVSIEKYCNFITEHCVKSDIQSYSLTPCALLMLSSYAKYRFALQWVQVECWSTICMFNLWV